MGKARKKVISNFGGLKIRKSFDEHSRLEQRLNIDLVITVRRRSFDLYFDKKEMFLITRLHGVMKVVRQPGWSQQLQS